MHSRRLAALADARGDHRRLGRPRRAPRCSRSARSTRSVRRRPDAARHAPRAGAPPSEIIVVRPRARAGGDGFHRARRLRLRPRRRLPAVDRGVHAPQRGLRGGHPRQSRQPADVLHQHPHPNEPSATATTSAPGTRPTSTTSASSPGCSTTTTRTPRSLPSAPPAWSTPPARPPRCRPPSGTSATTTSSPLATRLQAAVASIVNTVRVQTPLPAPTPPSLQITPPASTTGDVGTLVGPYVVVTDDPDRRQGDRHGGQHVRRRRRDDAHRQRRPRADRDTDLAHRPRGRQRHADRGRRVR